MVMSLLDDSIKNSKNFNKTNLMDLLIKPIRAGGLHLGLPGRNFN